MANHKDKWLINQLYDISDKTTPKQLKINHTEFSVLAAICKAAKNGTNRAKLGYARIHRLTGGISKNTIIRSIKSMKEKQVIKVHISIKSNKNQDDNLYEIHLENLTKENTNVIYSEGGGVPTMGRGGVPTMAPYKALSKNNYQEPKDIVRQRTSDDQILTITHDRYFEDFWSKYPRKEKKKDARAVWVRHRLDSRAAEIIEDVMMRQVRHMPWQDKNYIPIPTSYLNGERWTDEIIGEQHGQTKETKSNIENNPTVRAQREYFESLERERSR